MDEEEEDAIATIEGGARGYETFGRLLSVSLSWDWTTLDSRYEEVNSRYEEVNCRRASLIS